MNNKLLILFFFITLTGFNEFISYFLQTEEVFSYPILILLIIIFFQTRNIFRFNSTYLLVFVILFYLIIGSFYSVVNYNSDIIFSHYRLYLPSILIILIIGWRMQDYILVSSWDLEKIIFLMLMISNFSVLVFAVFDLNIIDDQGRYSSTLLNPNDSAFLSCFSFAILLANRRKFRKFWSIYLVISVIACLLSFSKTGFLNIIIILFLYFLLYRKTFSFKYIRQISFVLVVFSIIYINFSDKLNEFQALRINNFYELLFEGKIDATTTTKRSDIFNHSIDLIERNGYYSGYGLGTFHRIYSLERGSHNLFLMVFGESGLFPFIILLCFFVRFLYMAYNIIDSMSRFKLVSFLFIILTMSNTTHSFLISKANIILLTYTILLCSFIYNNQHKKNVFSEE